MIEKAAALGLSPQEFMVVTMIDFMNDHHMPVSLETISKMTGLEKEQVNEVFSTLCSKKYMDIRASKKDVRFSLEGMFQSEFRKEKNALDSSLIDVFESEFGRTLSGTEMAKISDLGKVYDKKLILYALQNASAYRKQSVQYVESTLVAWASQGVTADTIENKR